MPLGVFRELLPSISLDEIAELLGSPPRSARSHAEIVDLYSRYFNRPTGERSGPRRKLTVRERPLHELAAIDARFDTHPLCSGVVELDMVGGGDARFATATYQANVNPTRFVRYQDCNVLRLNHRPSGPPPLFRNQSDTTTSEYSLDGSDNWLSDRPSAVWQSFISQWPERLASYFNELETAIRGEMERRGEVSSIAGTNSLRFEPSREPWHLRRIETYWEFRGECSPELIALVDRAMASFNALPYSRQSTRRSRSRSRDSVNGLTLSLTANPGTKMIMYAKTNERIRFEVRHEVRDLAPRSQLPREANGVAGMVQALQAYSEDAAEALNVFFVHLERVAGPSYIAFSPSPTSLLFQLASLCEDVEAAKTITGLLLTQGAVSRIPRLDGSLRGLARAHVLERARNRQGQQGVTYILTPKFHHALHELQKITTETGLIIDRRLRNPRI